MVYVKKDLSNRRSLILPVFLVFFCGMYVSAQIAETVYRTNYEIDTSCVKQLFVEVDNITFLKNNEFSGDFIKGYTLPGCWLQPKLVYYPLKNIKLEGGLHLLRFWGADTYPNYAYSDISKWKANHYQHGFHLLPYLRVQAALSKNLTVVMGNIYGGANHRLIEPLYNPELNLLADPEAGLQVLFQSKSVDMDVWMNWESFIFDLDTHQEAFTVGVSSTIKYNSPASVFHIYSPIQLLAQHRGGELDTIQNNSVQTLTNASVGVGVLWNRKHGLCRQLNAELHFLGSYQQSGALWPFDNGQGRYASLSADINDFRFKTGYWQCEDFVSMFGSPFYGAVSMSNENQTFIKPQMVTCGVEYSKSFGKGYTLGADVDIYHHLPVDMQTPEGMIRRKGATSFTIGVYFRVNPSFLLKKANA